MKVSTWTHNSDLLHIFPLFPHMHHPPTHLHSNSTNCFAFSGFVDQFCSMSLHYIWYLIGWNTIVTCSTFPLFPSNLYLKQSNSTKQCNISLQINQWTNEKIKKLPPIYLWILSTSWIWGFKWLYIWSLVGWFLYFPTYLQHSKSCQ